MKLSRIRKPRERDDGVGEECPWYAPRRQWVIGVITPVLFSVHEFMLMVMAMARASDSRSRTVNITDNWVHTSAWDKH